MVSMDRRNVAEFHGMSISSKELQSLTWRGAPILGKRRVSLEEKTSFRWAAEPALEPVLRWLRIRKILPYVKERKGCSLLDIGCGPRFAMLRALSPYIRLGVGIDEEVEDLQYGNIRTYKLRLDKTLPFTSDFFQMVTMLAVLEHLDFPEEILKEVRRVMRPEGLLLITTPSPKAKPLLEFLSYKLHLVSQKEILDHKRYYDRKALEKLMNVCGFRMEKHVYFQLGFNNFLVATPIAETLWSVNILDDPS